MSSLWTICTENTERLLCAMGRIEVPSLRTALLIASDYQVIGAPGFNRDIVSVSVFGARLHWEL